ncbi:hypothetical protein [Methylobacterium oryzae]|uniref:hypothetical protein n=1 Tax=Methylobacterium oryzae TaxID=334852 RepID=UPI002F352B39
MADLLVRESHAMIVLTLVFAGLSALGALIGLGKVGHPMHGQLINSYGWALCINAAAIAAYLAFRQFAGEELDPSRRPPPARH